MQDTMTPDLDATNGHIPHMSGFEDDLARQSVWKTSGARSPRSHLGTGQIVREPSGLIPHQNKTVGTLQCSESVL